MAERFKLDDLEIAIVGTGVSLATIPVSRLIELLRVAEELIAAVAADLSVQTPSTSLIRVRNGSAAYQFHSADRHWRKTSTRVETALRRKGSRDSALVRERIRELHYVGGRYGKVRVTPIDRNGKNRGKPIVVEAPASSDVSVSFTATMYGRIVGLYERAADKKLFVQLDRDDGGRIGAMTPDDALFGAAVTLLRKTVRVRVEGNWNAELGEEEAGGWKLLSIEPWTEKDLADALSEVRGLLDKRGVTVDVDGILRDLGES